MRILHELVTMRGYLAVSTLGVGVAALAAHPAATPPAQAPALAIAPHEDVARIEISRTHETTPATAEVVPVFTSDGSSYLALADLDATARTANARITETDGVLSLVAPLGTKLPAAARAWKDQHVIVDGTCHANVIGFAIVARLSGDPGYAGIPGDHPKWTARGILDNGHVVLAAKLDHCSGTFARAAAAPPIRPFTEAPDDAHAALARARLLASEPGAGAAIEWKSFHETGAWFDYTVFSTRTVRDPRTGTEWISMHAHDDYGCGGPSINIWGLFRVEPDGALTTVQLRELGDLHQIDQLVDVDNDGIPELVGRGWISPDAAITSAAGAELVRFDTPFFGCPC